MHVILILLSGGSYNEGGAQAKTDHPARSFERLRLNVAISNIL